MPHSKTVSLRVSLSVLFFALAIFLVFPVCAAEVETESRAQTVELEKDLAAEPREDPVAACSETDEKVTAPASKEAQDDAMISDILANGFTFQSLEQTSGCGPLGCPAPGRCKLSCHYCWTSSDCPLVAGLWQGCTGSCL